MKTITRSLAFVHLMIWLAAQASAGDGTGTAPKTAPVRSGAAPSPVELMQAVQKLGELVEQGRMELRQLREHNESLELELDRTRRDVAQLRNELARLSGGGKAETLGTPDLARGGREEADSSDAFARQSSPPASQPDLAARIGIVEERVAVNAAQIREQAQTKVESDSRYNVRLTGMILSNTYFNTSDTSETAVPTVAPPGSVRVANGGNNFGSTLRQTTLGFAMTGPHLGNARLSAHAGFDFYGGAAGVYQGEMLGVMRMRTAAARLEGPDYAVDAGLLEPMISPLSPESLASVYYPALGDAGNLWQWRPQFNAERRFAVSGGDSVVLQGGLILPFGENFYGRALEGKPGYQSRLAFSKRDGSTRRLEVGAGGYYYPYHFGFGRTVSSYAVTGDWAIPVHGRLELKGEVYHGESVTLSEPAGGDISGRLGFNGFLDNPATVFRGIRSTGGWAQLHLTATPRLGFNVAFGADDPRNDDYFRTQLRSTTRFRNQAFSVNSIYRLRSNFLFSLEFRRHWTHYPDRLSTNSHVNFAVGYAF